MIKRSRVIGLVVLIVSISLISIACSKKETEPTGGKVQAMEDSDEQEEVSATETSEGEEYDSPWKLLSDTSVSTSVYYAGFLNESVGVTVGYAGAVSYTLDGGKNWVSSDISSACRYGLDFYDESFLISCGNYGVNMLSTDEGKNWSSLDEFPIKSGKFNKFLSVIDHENIYIGAPEKLGVTNDAGKTWNDIEVPQECEEIAGMFFLTSKIGYLLSLDGILFKTTDSCVTWTKLPINLSWEEIKEMPMSAAAINFRDENNGIIVLAVKSNESIYLKTIDGGKTWESTKIPEALGQAPYLSRDGKYLTLSSITKEIDLYKLEDE